MALQLGILRNTLFFFRVFFGGRGSVVDLVLAEKHSQGQKLNTQLLLFPEKWFLKSEPPMELFGVTFWKRGLHIFPQISCINSRWTQGKERRYASMSLLIQNEFTEKINLQRTLGNHWMCLRAQLANFLGSWHS